MGHKMRPQVGANGKIRRWQDGEMAEIAKWRKKGRKVGCKDGCKDCATSFFQAKLLGLKDLVSSKQKVTMRWGIA